jgi:cbb3-type cytochrome c oxidase subunit III
LRRTLPVALLLAAALVVGGCGTGGMATSHGDQQNGQKLFTTKCAACHTLAAAGTSGTLGPNLDDAFSGPKAQHFKESTLENVVLDQIREASAPMPANLVKGQDAVDVAAYVAAVAGAGGPGAKPPSQLGTNGKAIFSSQCSGCHTLKAAGAAGTIGPNLDTLKPSLARVQRQVTNGGSVMPAFKSKLTQAQIAAVATFVSSSAGK